MSTCQDFSSSRRIWIQSYVPSKQKASIVPPRYGPGIFHGDSSPGRYLESTAQASLSFLAKFWDDGSAAMTRDGTEVMNVGPVPNQLLYNPILAILSAVISLDL